MEHLGSKRSRYLRVSQGIFSVQRRCETEKSADHNISKSDAADAFLHATFTFSNSYWRIILVAVRPVKLPRLRKRTLFSHLSRPAVEIKCVGRKTESPHCSDRKRWPAVVSTHRPVVGPVGNGGGGVFEAHRAHPVAHKKLAFDEICHFTAHVRRQVAGERIADIDVINAMSQFDTLAVLV